MKITIPGNPIAKARHRTRVVGKRAFMYDPQDKQKVRTKIELVQKLKEAFHSENKEIVKNASNLASADYFFINVCFYVEIPKSATKTKRNRMAWGLLKPASKPDFDNYAKYICDCANNVLFRDDCMITRGKVIKEYSTNPRTEIEIMPKKNPNENDPVVKILSICSPAEYQNIVYITSQMALVMNSSILESDDLQEAASLLSKLADNHGECLKKISKTCPGYWKENDYTKTSMEGKALS